VLGEIARPYCEGRGSRGMVGARKLESGRQLQFPPSIHNPSHRTCLADFMHRICLRHELSLLRPLLLDFSAVRSFRANAEDESRCRLFHRLQPGTSSRSPSTVATSPPAFRPGARICLQPLDLGKLIRCHLLYQVHDRLLLDLANLYQLHAAHSRRR